MATYTKLTSGAWRVQIRLKLGSASGNFRTKSEAQAWAAKREHEIRSGSGKIKSHNTVKELFEHYLRKVSKDKPGHKWEQVRVDAFCRSFPKLAAKTACEVTSVDFAHWRDQRLLGVSAATVLREMNLFSHAFNVARTEWKWLSDNPFTDVRRPKKPPGRDRRITRYEIDLIQHALGYTREGDPETASARVGAAFELAIETAMRSGEICALTHEHLYIEERYVHLPKTKNGSSRNVPLSLRAVEILEQLARVRKLCGKTVFGLSDALRDALFRKARSTAIPDLHFHDSRHEAITRLSSKLEVLELARMVGIRDLKILMVYYNKHARDIALSLD